MLRVFTLITGLLISLPLFAHGIWFEHRTTGTTIVYGHGAEEEAYQQQHLKSLTLTTADGKQLTPEQRFNSAEIQFDWPTDASYATAVFSQGYWSQLKNGKWVNKAKDQVENAKRAGQYIKYGVALKGSRPVDLPAEIKLALIPVTSPFQLSAGEVMQVRALFNGEPLAHTAIIGDHTNLGGKIAAVTDSNGYATVKIRNNGLNVLAIEYKEVSAERTKADTINYFSTLSFSLAANGH